MNVTVGEEDPLSVLALANLHFCVVDVLQMFCRRQLCMSTLHSLSEFKHPGKLFAETVGLILTALLKCREHLSVSEYGWNFRERIVSRGPLLKR